MQVINSSNLPLIDYRKLVPLQGSLKDLSEKNYKKLLKSIETEGFFIPIFVYFEGDTPYILDAHQRHRVLTNEKIEFENTGFEIPYVTVEAKDKKDAAIKLLKISSQYGTITQEGIDEFMATYGLNEAEVYEATSFDAITQYAPVEQEIALPDGGDPDFQQMTFTLHNSQKQIVDEALIKAKNYIVGDEPNENSNGNALYYLAKALIDG